MKLATLWARIGGGLIDLLIVLLISAVILFLWGILIGLNGSEIYISAESQEMQWKARGFLVGLFVDMIYTVSLQISQRQATYGMQLLKIKIIKKDGGKVFLLRGLGRYVVSIFSSLLLKVGYLIALSPSRQTLHDMVAGTIVVKNNKQENSNDEEKLTTNKNYKFIALIITTACLTTYGLSYFVKHINEKTFELEDCTSCGENGCKPEIKLTSINVKNSYVTLIYKENGKEKNILKVKNGKNYCEVIREKNFAFDCYNKDTSTPYVVIEVNDIFNGKNEFKQIINSEFFGKKYVDTTTCKVK